LLSKHIEHYQHKVVCLYILKISFCLFTVFATKVSNGEEQERRLAKQLRRACNKT